MFSWAKKFNGNLSRWNFSNVNNTLAMFQGASSFQGTGIDQWNTSQITSMAFMFTAASTFNGNLSNWDVANVKSMDVLFRGAKSFEGIGVDRWNISNVESLYGTFYDAGLFNANLSGWDMSKVLNTSYMFALAYSFVGSGVETWNTSRIENM